MGGHAPEDLEILARGVDREWHTHSLNPDWDSSPGPHDWRHFIDPDVRRLWSKIDYTGKMMAYIIAARMAKRVRDRAASRSTE